MCRRLASIGKKVVQIGCDPKADSTLNLLHGEPVMPVMDYYRQYTEGPDFDHIGKEGYGGVFCIETGGPTPGLGCAGRGIIATFDLIDELEVFEKLSPDVVMYDVLGDVVCGGFSAPIRDGYADEIFIVTSGEKMALYAAANIFKAVENFKSRGYAQVKGSFSIAAMSTMNMKRSRLLPMNTVCPSWPTFPAVRKSSFMKTRE